MLRELAFVERFKQKSMYGPSAKKAAVLERLERVNVWIVGQRSGPFRDVAVSETNVFRHRMLNSKVDVLFEIIIMYIPVAITLCTESQE